MFFIFRLDFDRIRKKDGTSAETGNKRETKMSRKPIRVAVRIRPLLPLELDHTTDRLNLGDRTSGRTDCVTLRVSRSDTVEDKSFKFDHVFGPDDAQVNSCCLLLCVDIIMVYVPHPARACDGGFISN